MCIRDSRWFGPYAEQIQVVASGNLPYNQAQLARKGLGLYLAIELDCAYEGLRMLPLSPPLESSTVLEMCIRDSGMIRHISRSAYMHR